MCLLREMAAMYALVTGNTELQCEPLRLPSELLQAQGEPLQPQCELLQPQYEPLQQEYELLQPV